MKKLSTKWFNKWSRKTKIKNHDLLETIRNLENDLSSANIGNHLYKVRVKKEHSGKRSGFRTIIVYQEDNRAIFLYGFGKNEKENISKTELQYFKTLAHDFLALSTEQLENLVDNNILFDLEKNK